MSYRDSGEIGPITRILAHRAEGGQNVALPPNSVSRAPKTASAKSDEHENAAVQDDTMNAALAQDGGAVLIADDHPLFRDALAQIVASALPHAA